MLKARQSFAKKIRQQKQLGRALTCTRFSGSTESALPKAPARRLKELESNSINNENLIRSKLNLKKKVLKRRHTILALGFSYLDLMHQELQLIRKSFHLFPFINVNCQSNLALLGVRSLSTLVALNCLQLNVYHNLLVSKLLELEKEFKSKGLVTWAVK